MKRRAGYCGFQATRVIGIRAGYQPDVQARVSINPLMGFPLPRALAGQCLPGSAFRNKSRVINRDPRLRVGLVRPPSRSARIHWRTQRRHRPPALFLVPLTFPGSVTGSSGSTLVRTRRPDPWVYLKSKRSRKLWPSKGATSPLSLGMTTQVTFLTLNRPTETVRMIISLAMTLVPSATTHWTVRPVGLRLSREASSADKRRRAGPGVEDHPDRALAVEHHIDMVDAVLAVQLDSLV